LKIKDLSLFGQSVKCPGCKKPFVLRDPNEPAPTVAAPKPSPGAKQTPSAFPDFSKFDDDNVEEDLPPILAGMGGPPKSSSRKSSGPSASRGSSASSSPARHSGQASKDDTNAAFQLSTPPAGVPIVPAELAADSSAEILYSARKQSKKSKWFNLVLGGVLLVSAIGLGIYFATTQPVASRPAPASGTLLVEKKIERPVDPNQPYSRQLLQQDAELISEFKPTSGQPIELYMMPSGINMLIHLRPAQLWSDNYNYKVLRSSLTDDVMSWMKSQITALCLRAPEQIEELTIGVLLGARGVPPQFCCVVHLKEPEKLSTLIDIFPGKYLYEITERPNLRIKVDDQRGYLIHDEKTYAICPVGMADELEYSIQTPNHDVSVGMSELLARTDRERLFTAVGDLRDLEIHLNALFPETARPFFHALSEWMGENIEMASWSAHPEPYFHSEIALRPVSTMEVATLDTVMKTKLEKLPELVWKELCAKMHPREMRFRNLIGRLPAMLQAFQESTVSRREKRCVFLTTVLPAKASPNLALATMFTIDEASRTSFETPTIAANQASKPKLPETIAERLKMPVDAEFNRTPFEQAVTYLCGEIQAQVHVDGDALKDAGYTKNMPQTFNLGKVPMQRALFEIVNAYQEDGKEMVISIDEKTKTITILTKKFAEAKGLPIYPLKAE